MDTTEFKSKIDNSLLNLKTKQIHNNSCADVACIELDEEIEQLIEAESYEDSCGPELEDDLIDSEIKDWVRVVCEQDYIEEDAELAVHDALADLIENYELDDTPDYDSSEEEKNLWLNNFRAKIKYKLEELGIEFRA